MTLSRSVRDASGPGPSGYVQSWLSSWGFTENPFGHWEASEEPLLERYFVRPPFFEQLLESPRSTLVFAPRGGGKSATRIMIEALYRPRTPDSPVFGVSFTDFSPFVEMYGRVPDLTLNNYVPSLIRCALPGLLAGVFLATVGREGPSVVELGMLHFWLEHCRPHLHHGHLLSTAMATIDPGLDPHQRMLLAAGISNQVSVSAEAPDWLARLAQFWDRLHNTAVVPPPGRMDLASRLMQTFIESVFSLFALGRTPCHTFCLLIDGVDEFAETQSDPESTARLLYPLIANLRFLEIPGFVLKFFLPVEQRSAIERIVRTDRIETCTLSWGTPQSKVSEELRALLRRRIVAHNARGMRDLGELCAAPLRRTIEDELLEEAGHSPRNLMRLGNLLFTEHCRREADANSVITLDEWEAARDRFRASNVTTAHETTPVYVAEPTPAQVPSRAPAPPSGAGLAHDGVLLLRLDLSSGELWIGTQKGPVPSDLEFKLLRHLYLNRGQICTKAEIARAVYDPQGLQKDELVDAYGDSINQLVRRLRKRIEENPKKPQYVHTIKGRGYRLDHAE